MSVKQLSEYIRVAKYSRFLPTKKRREKWQEQVHRVMDMHRLKLKDIPEAMPYVDEGERAMLNKLVLGSQRALQFASPRMLEAQAKIYNCSYSHLNRLRFFQEAMYLLLCGCGVGFSVQTQHIAKLPDIAPRTKGKRTFVIPDTIEGWADAVGVLMASYCPTGNEFCEEWHGYEVEFDFSEIRPEGSIIKSSGHKSGGYKGLQQSLTKCAEVIDRRLADGHTRLRSVDAYDVTMWIADSVLSGGVRRSATICLMSKGDTDMINAKTGNWFYENPQRGRSNNSVIMLRDEVTKDEFKAVMKALEEFGEPAFLLTDDLEIGVNPCVEIGLDCVDRKGNTGFAFCNLTEINGRMCTTREAFFEACRASAVIGTIQASYTTFPYLFDPMVGYNVTEAIAKDEALLGCSITGIQDNPHILLDPETLREGARLVKKVNEEVAKAIGINTASRTTAVKPAGTTSLLLRTASGIHFHHARRYFRRVQANRNENTLKFFQLFNDHAVKPSVWSTGGTDQVITFLCEVPSGARVKNEHSAIDLLEDVKNVQQNWVVEGTRHERSKLKNITHNVSNTISVMPNEWEAVGDFIYENRKWFAGVSLLSGSGDLDYPQAPFQAVHTPIETAKKYGDGSLMASGLIVDGLRAFDDNLWLACDHATGMLPLGDGDEEKIDWVRRAVKFAKNYFDGDLKKMTYCLKEVHSWKEWCDLKRDYMDVPWEELVEDDHQAKNAGDESATACAGGACEITKL